MESIWIRCCDSFNWCYFPVLIYAPSSSFIATIGRSSRISAGTVHSLHVRLIHLKTRWSNTLMRASTADSKLVLQHWVCPQTPCRPLTTQYKKLMIQEHLETSLKLNNDCSGQVCKVVAPEELKQLTVFPLLLGPKVEWAPSSHWWTSLPESRRTNCCDSAGLATAITSVSVIPYLSDTLWTRSFVANNSSRCQQLRQPTEGVRSRDKCCTSAWDVATSVVARLGWRDPLSFLQTSRWRIPRLPLWVLFLKLCYIFESSGESWGVLPAECSTHKCMEWE